MENNQNEKEQLVNFKYFDRIHKEYVLLKMPYSMKKEIDKIKEKEKYANKKYEKNTIPLELILDEAPDVLPIQELDDPENILLEKNFKILSNILKEQKRIIIENALYELTDKQREVIEMIFYHNMTYAEIALRLNINVSTVCHRKEKAIKNIKRYIIRTKN